MKTVLTRALALAILAGSIAVQAQPKDNKNNGGCAPCPNNQQTQDKKSEKKTKQKKNNPEKDKQQDDWINGIWG